MKKHSSLFLLLIMCIPALNAMEQKPISGMEQGPMNAVWFYDQSNPFYPANKFHQDRQWKDAVLDYKKLLNAGFGTSYDKEMAELNLAACIMARGKPTKHWGAFDALIGIAPEKCISKGMIDTEVLYGKLVLVRTDKVGIGDVFHFLEGANILRKRTGCYVIFSVRDFLKDTLLSATNAYDFGLVGEKSDELPETDYTTHIISLLGHLRLDPVQTVPERVVLTAPERAMVAVAQQVDPILAQGKIVVMVNAGENRQATLIGGKQLPRNSQAHGRHLSSEAFRALLANHPELVLIDCGTKDGRVSVGEDQKEQYMLIAQEEQAFDTPIALALLMNDRKKIIGFGADNGPANVFIRALTKAAQRRMALIIPNAGEYDMRMEGKGSVYKQMISNCTVYKCDTPQDQTEVIEKAYQRMTDEEVDHFPIV